MKLVKCDRDGCLGAHLELTDEEAEQLTRDYIEVSMIDGDPIITNSKWFENLKKENK